MADYNIQNAVKFVAVVPYVTKDHMHNSDTFISLFSWGMHPGEITDMGCTQKKSFLLVFLFE